MVLTVCMHNHVITSQINCHSHQCQSRCASTADSERERIAAAGHIHHKLHRDEESREDRDTVRQLTYLHQKMHRESEMAEQTADC